MIVLGRIPREPHWLPEGLPYGIRLFVRPAATPVVEATREAALRRVREMAAAVAERRALRLPLDPGMPDLEDEAVRLGHCKALYVQELAVQAVIAWEGVFERDGDAAPAAVTPDRIRELMSLPAVSESFEELYCLSAKLLGAEGNGSGPAPDGTGAAGPNTAPGAGRPAGPAPRPDAPREGPSAPTGSTSP